MSSVGLQERLATLQESTAQLTELVDRLGNLKFQPGSVPLGADEEDSVSGELSLEIGQLLKVSAEDQELLLEEANYLRPEGHEKERLIDGVVRVGDVLTKLRLSFRKARLQARKSLVEAQKLERKLILKSYSAPVPEFEPPTDDDANTGSAQQPLEHTEQHNTTTSASSHHYQHRSIHHSRSGLTDEDQQTVGASSHVTASLRRTHDLIAAELSRSEFAHQTLTESSAALRQLDDSYGSLDSMLAQSRDLLGTLLRSQKSDTWYLQTAFYMLAVTGAWLVFRRLLYGPIWWLVLFPLRVLFGIGSTATRAVLPAVGKSAQSGQVIGQSGGVKDTVPVNGLPDETLPTATVAPQAGGDLPKKVQQEMDEAIKEAVDEAIKRGEEEAEQSETSKEQSTGKEASPLVDDVESKGRRDGAHEEPLHEKDEL